MWGRDTRRKWIINTMLGVLILAAAVFLFFFMLRQREKTQEYDEQLAQMQAQQQQEQTAAREESVENIDREYQRQMDIVTEYMPGIVCWGDNTTAASFGVLNYPSVLQTYINTYICNIYDFSNTIENALEFARLDWKKYRVSIPVVNMGTGRESSSTVVGRANGYVLAETLTVGDEPVPIRFTGMDGKDVMPLTAGDVHFNNVTVGGVEGVIEIDSSNTNRTGKADYTFRRLGSGPEVTIEAGAEVMPASAGMYRDYIHVVLLGMYGGYDSAGELVEQVRALLSRQGSDRYIVLGPYITLTSEMLDDVDSAMLAAFGNKYISIRQYLIGDVYTSGTSENEEYVRNGLVPPMYKVSAKSEELNSVGHALVGKLLYSRMDSLGYFDEIKSELGIADVTQKILKKQPEYFETIIRNSLG